MQRRRPTTRATQTFGQRLAQLRKARGLTQRDLAAKIGLSYRMVAYYEAQTDRPPAHLLPELARVLGASLDELLGVDRIRADPPPMDVRLWRRFEKIQRLPPATRRAVLKVLDAYLDRYLPARTTR